MKSFYFTVLIFSCICLSVWETSACTSAIITGKITADGRPLLWKHRDTDNENNCMAFVKGAKYDFLALLSSSDKDGIAWMGSNSAGFSIMNTASYNLKDDTIIEMDREGALMYKALSECRNLADFEAFLDHYPRPMRVEANFGVIDAEGGAAYYEVNNTRWTKVDANDPKIAPHGYLIYTNFSYTGRFNEGMGYIRHQTATEIISRQAAMGNITPHWIFNHLSRSYYHSLTGVDLLDKDFSPEKATGWVWDQDFIPRKITSASLVIQGVKPGENPEMTTVWTVLGYPPVGMAVPMWVKAGKRQPDILLRNDTSRRATICDYALALKRRIFPLKRGNGSKYVYFNRIYNSRGTGYMQQLAPAEEKIFQLYREAIEQWRQQGLNLQQLDLLNATMETMAKAAYDAVIDEPDAVRVIGKDNNAK
ncbi:MAG: hypothetical protein LBB85_00550 [Dysgonamonadaceae bacterium]|jgi:hypothetical protein|nr:hypothetical protein [Dysgonamonadaceae bacterium]